MLRSIIAITTMYSALIMGCSNNSENDPIVNPSMLDSSFVEIMTTNGLLFRADFHPCGSLGSVSTWINHPDTSLYQPIVVMPYPFNLSSDFLFYIYFKSTDIPVDRDPGINELLTMLNETLKTGFNIAPHMGDIIFYVRLEGKRYSNSWDPESGGLASPPYIKDRTGLKVDLNGYEVVQNDCRDSTFPSIRLALEVEGWLVTSNQIDSLWIEGKLDFLMATSVF